MREAFISANIASRGYMDSLFMFGRSSWLKTRSSRLTFLPSFLSWPDNAEIVYGNILVRRLTHWGSSDIQVRRRNRDGLALFVLSVLVTGSMTNYCLVGTSLNCTGSSSFL